MDIMFAASRLLPSGARLAVVLAVALCALPAVGLEDAFAECLPLTPCLEASFPAGYAWGALDAGPAGNASAEQVVVVTSTDPWGLRISSDLAEGRMSEWTGTAYVSATPKVLAAPLGWGLSRIGDSPQTPSYTPLSSTPASVVSGRPGTCAMTCAPLDIGVRYRQVVSYGDASAGVNDYRIQTSFEASHGF